VGHACLNKGHIIILIAVARGLRLLQHPWSRKLLLLARLPRDRLLWHRWHRWRLCCATATSRSNGDVVAGSTDHTGSSGRGGRG
jgi:hypothetical protein